jgi:hypothetical protein
MNAQELLIYLLELQEQGNDLSKISLEYRYDPDSDAEHISFASEGYYDTETSSKLESLMFYTEVETEEDWNDED